MINLSKCKTEQEVQAAMDYEHLKTKYIILEHDIYNISIKNEKNSCIVFRVHSP